MVKNKVSIPETCLRKNFKCYYLCGCVVLTNLSRSQIGLKHLSLLETVHQLFFKYLYACWPFHCRKLIV